MPKTKILIVEDEAIIAMNVQSILEARGYDVIGSALSGEEAVELTETHSPDLIIMDIILDGEMDGITAYEKIKEKHDIPIIYQTAHSDEKTLNRAKATEPHGYILKPIKPNELYLTIEIALYKHEMERKLRESEKKYRLLADNASDNIFILNLDMEFEYISPSITRIAGYTVEEIMSMKWLETYTPESQDIILKTFEDELSRDGKDGVDPDRIVTLEIELIRKDGSIIWIENRTKALRDEDGKLTGVLGVTRDISDRKQFEESFLESENRYKALIDSSINLVYIFDFEGNFIDANNVTLDLLSYKREEIKSLNFASLLSEDQLPKAFNTLEEILETGTQTKIIEFKLRKKDGTYVYAETDANIIYREGKPYAIQGIARDITARRIAEKRIAESEEKYRLLAENSSDIIWTMTLDGRFSYVSPSVETLTGFSVKEVMNIPFDKYVTSESYKRVFELLGSELQKPVEQRQKIFILELQQYLKDGSIIDIETTSFWIYNSSGETIGLQGSTRNITERKQAERSLIKSEEKFRNFVENANDIVYSISTEGVFTYVSPNWTEILGHDVSEVIGKSLALFVHSDDIPICAAALEKVMLNGDRLSNIEYRVKHKNGSWRYHRSNSSPLKDDKGNVISNVGVAHDFTDYKLAEEKLKVSLKEKDTLLKEVHHRVKNNFQVISSLLGLQSMKVRDKHDRELFNDTQSRIQSMSLIHDRLYQSKNLADINFSNYVQSLVSEIEHMYYTRAGPVKTNINVKEVFLGIDMAIPCALIINELVSNSYKHAFPEGIEGEITLKFSNDKSGNFKLAISDNGIGLPGKLDFRKTESLGLQLVNALTKQLRGHIKLGKGKGTKFTITFPALAP